MRGVLLLGLALLLLGCPSQQAGANVTANASGGIELVVANGDTVAVDYLGTLDNGTVFDTSIREEAVKGGLPLRPSYSPLVFGVGAGQMIAGFDKAVVGMKVGETKSVHLQPSEAYGEKRTDLVVSIPRANAPAGVSVGSQVQASNGMPGVVLEVTNSSVKVDFNHQLAGQALNFKIIMRKITKGQ